MAYTKTSVEISYPFASAPDEPTIFMQFPTSPGFASGATVSQKTARELRDELSRVLGELPEP